MEIFDTWFDIREELSDADNGIQFLYGLPEKIRILTFETNSNFFGQLRISDSENITIESFLEALREAERILFQNLEEIQSRLANYAYRNRFSLRLLQAGLTGRSLTLKAAVLNAHWQRVKRRVGNAAGAIINFANLTIVKPLRRFFEFLNSILGSFAGVIPGSEAIKEIKDILESYLGIADD